MTRNEQRWLGTCARHEAAHAVVAVLLGVKIVDCALGGGISPHCLTGIEVEDNVIGDGATPEQLQLLMCCALAPGQVRNGFCSRPDTATAHGIAVRLAGEMLAMSAMEAQAQRARNMLIENPALFNAVVGMLLEKDRVSDEEVRALVKGEKV
jgi:hypothetical protein